MARKTRTREHIIADYSGIHVERFALDCGYSIERIMHDYGIDLLMFTYAANGELENGSVAIQLKASDAPRYLVGGKTVSHQISCTDLETWQKEPMPVVLILYDALKEIAYWLHIQEYLKNIGFDAQTAKKSLRVTFPITNVLNKEAIETFAERKNKQIEEYWKAANL